MFHLRIIVTALICFLIASSPAHSKEQPKENHNLNTRAPYKFDISIGKTLMSNIANLNYSLIESYRYLNDSTDDLLFGKSKSTISNTLKTTKKALSIVPIAWTSVLQHELGHASRVREFGGDVREIVVTPFSGYVSYYGLFHSQETAAIAIAGMESTHVLAQKIQKKSIIEGRMSAIHGLSYIVNQTDQMNYIAITKENSEDSNDVNAYINNMNDVYGSNFLNLRTLKNNRITDWFDPFLYISAYAALASQDSIEIPMIKLGDTGVKYLPALKLVLTPYGLERRLSNHFVKDDRYYRLNLSHGDNAGHTSYAIDMNVNNIKISDKHTLNIESSIWRQPELFTSNPITAKDKFGALINLQLVSQLSKSFDGFIEAGYKTSGFKQGLPFKNSLLFGLGITFTP